MFITPKKSKELIAKLATFVEPCQKQILKRQLYVDCRTKAGNEAILRIVDNIHTAIAGSRKISFQYYDYTPTKQKVHRHDGMRYVVSPYAMLWNNDFYYVVGYSDSQGFTATYRADRIDNLTVLDEPAAHRPRNFDISDYFGQTFSMFSGEECHVELLCENELMGSIIDRFGENVDIEVVDQEHFKVGTTVSLSNNFFGWVFASGGKMRITAPQKAVSQFCDLLDSFS